MDKLLKNIWAKMAGVLIFSILMTGTAFFSMSAVVLEAEGAYSYSEDAFIENSLETTAFHKTQTLLDASITYYDDGGDDLKYEVSDFLGTAAEKYVNTGFLFKITDDNKKVIFSNYDKDKEYTYKYNYNAGMVNAEIYVDIDLKGNTEADKIASLAHKAYQNKTNVIFYAVILFILSIFVFAFLVIGAGRRKGSREIHKHFIDKIPGDIYTVAVGVAIIGLVALCFMVLEQTFSYGNVSVIFSIALASVIAAIGFALFMIYAMSMSVQLKCRSFCKNTVIGRIIILIRRAVLKIPYIWRTMIVSGAVLLINVIVVACSCYNAEAAVFFCIEGIVLLAGICYAALNLNRLRAGGEAIAKGDTDYKVNTDKMFFDFKKHGENLNCINRSISLAVEKQLKSERLKTELITNVSHDIKTPLTSIINYTELLKQESLDNSRAAEYIEILDKQALRLKKLTEDIVEASKASTGNLPVEFRECSLGMILNQALGEYEEKLYNAGLKPVVTIADEDMRIMADGKHLWRIIDNLLGNICKYAQEGTRVYMDVYREENKAVMSFKNISKYELNISADELIERFVRGDASRNSDGSGLGLSIAKSLADIQKGNLKLDIDGDLFKATVEFNII